MIPDGMTKKQANKAFAKVKASVVDGLGAHGRSETIRERWAKKCGVDFKPRLGPIGTTVPDASAAQADNVDPALQKERDKDDASDAEAQRGRGVGRAVPETIGGAGLPTPEPGMITE